MPTEAFRNGDFSGAPQRTFDPLTQRQTGPNQFTRDAFPDNRIPANRINPVGRNLLNLFPLPNLDCGVANNFLFNPVRSIMGNKFDFKVDQTFSQRDTAFVRYSASSDDLVEPSFLAFQAATFPETVLTSGLSIFSISGLPDLGDNGFTPAVVVSDTTRRTSIKFAELQVEIILLTTTLENSHDESSGVSLRFAGSVAGRSQAAVKRAADPG